jgi:DNA-binding NarL/FixJ family response regulator
MATDLPIRILIADDSTLVRRQLRKLLENRVRGVVVDEAQDGGEAVEKVRKDSPDIAILDVAMPVLNGLVAAERISEIDPDLPIVVHTMYATPQIEDEVKKRGAKAVVPKDDVKALVSIVQRLSEEEIGMSPDWL